MSFAIRRFEEIGMADIPLVGGKNASLGEMVRALGARGIRVPGGFAVTAEGYRAFLEHNELGPALSDLLSGPAIADVAELQRRGKAARRMLGQGAFPPSLRTSIGEAYAALGSDVDVAVRSSATAEDLPEASFAGQQETYLNVHGAEAVLDAVRRCYASLFTDRAISYRAERGFDHLAVALSVGIQRMVRSDLASAGVIFTLDTESGFRDVVLVTGAWGLGETVVQGTVIPDEWVVFKPTLRTGHRPILRRTIGSKETKLVYDVGGGRSVRSVPVPVAERARPVLTDDEVLELARQACLVEAHYSQRLGRPCPMDLEWAKDGRTGELFIVQARPETVESRHAPAIEHAVLDGTGPVLVEGRSVGQRIGAGPVRVINDVTELPSFQDGEVLVSERTDPDWEPVMRRAAAVVTNRGGRTCHAAIVSRELGLPAIVGAAGATERLRDAGLVTVDCSGGEIGRVYAGALPFHVEHVDADALPRPNTQVKVNVGSPDEAFRISRLPNDGVGLARLEFIVSAIGVHPMALVGFAAISDPALRRAIETRTGGAADKAAWFVERLAEGVGTIAAAFYPKHVLVRFSDFKTNEYAHLLGGEAFEPKEENPMIGFRGASRYYDPRYREAFELECRAMTMVRNQMGLTNVHLMVPFCRTVDEGKKVLAAMRENGLEQGTDGLEVFVMCEIPSNVILIEEFAQLFDGFSIGSNDLTQLVLGVDRDAEALAPLFDERDEAVRRMIALAIKGAHAAGRPIGICGQAPSDYPEMAAWLVERGIDSVSLNPDTVIATTRRILDAERGRVDHLPALRPTDA